MGDLAGVLLDQEEYEAAEAQYRWALEVRRNHELKDSSAIASTLNNLALALKEQGELAAADSLYRKSLSIKREILPPSGRRTTIHNRAYVLMEQGRYAMADSLFLRALALRRTADGKRSVDVAQTQIGRARLAFRRGDYRKAERLARTALDIRREHFPSDHPLVQESLRSLVKIYEAWGRQEQLSTYRQRLAARSEGGS